MNPPFDGMASLTIQRGLSVNCSGAFTYTHFQSLIPKLILLFKTAQIHVEMRFSHVFLTEGQQLQQSSLGTQGQAQVGACVAAVVGPAELSLHQQFGSAGAATGGQSNAFPPN